MASLNTEATITFKTKGDLSGLSQVDSGITGLSDHAKNAGLVMGGAFIAAGAAVIGVGAVSVKMAGDFQQAMELIQTQAGASSTEVKNMSKAVLDLAPVVGTGPEELATALYHIESVGYRGAQALDILKISAEGAKVGNADLEDVTNALSAAVVSGISGVQNMTQAMGVLNATVGAGNMRMQDLAQSLSSGILATAKTAGLSIRDVGAALATMTDNGVPAVEASTRLRMSISLLAAPTANAADELKKIGLSQLTLANDMRSGGIIKAMEDLKSHLDAIPPVTETMVKSTKMNATQLEALQQKIDNTQTRLKILGEEHAKTGVQTDKHNLSIQNAKNQLANYTEKLGSANTVLEKTGGVALTASEKFDLLSRAFGGGKSSSTILTLIDQLDRLKTKYQDISGSAGQFNEKWDETQRNVNFQMSVLTAKVQELAIKLGDKLLPFVNSFLATLNTKMIPALESTAKWVEKNQKLLELLGAVIATVVVPPLIVLYTQMAINNVKAMVDFILWGDKLIAQGVIMAANFIFSTVQIIAQTVAMVAVRTATGLWTAAQWLLNIALDANPIGLVIIAIAALTAGVIYAYNHSETFRKIVNDLWGVLKSFWSFLVTALTPAINDIAAALKFVADVAGKAMGAINSVINSKGSVPHFASGVNNFSGGMALVGEQGPELVSLPRGASVIPNNQLKNYNKSSSDGVVVNQTNNIYSNVDMQAAMRTLGYQLAIR